jgi:hypothetical protein
MTLDGAEKLPEQVRYEAVQSDLRRAHMTLQVARWSDSLSALLLDETTTRETESRMRLGTFWQSVTHGAVPDVPLGIPVMASLTFADVAGSMPYCFTVHTHPAAVDDFSGVALADLPDPCRLLDRFGAPGARIGEWLERGAWGFGSSRVPLPDQMRLRDRSYAEMPLFGTRRHPLSDANPVAGGCLAGDVSDCSRAVTNPVELRGLGAEMRSAVGSSALSYADVPWADESPFGYLDDSLFAELEHQFGEEAFGRFWSSDQDVPLAFEAAFGVGLGEWVLSWVSGQTGIARAGPGTPLEDLLSGILAVSALAALTSLVAMRRRVG